MENTEKQTVLQDWVCELSFRKQTILLTAIRGCDTASKHDVSKKIVKDLRSNILKDAGGGNFMHTSSPLNYQDIKEFADDIGKYPFHFVSHISDAAKILSCCHPHAEVRGLYGTLRHSIYKECHMILEPVEEMYERLD